MILNHNQLENELNYILDTLKRVCDKSEKSGDLAIGDLIKSARQDINLAGAYDMAWDNIASFLSCSDRDFGKSFSKSAQKVKSHFATLRNRSR